MNDPALQAAFRAHQLGNLAEAARLYGEILQRDPTQFDALYAFGVLNYSRSEFTLAEAMLRRAAERNPRRPEPWFTLGAALHRLNRLADALAAFDKALAIRPGYVEALVNKGGALLALRRQSEALESLDAALALNPNMAEAWNNRGNALSELGRHDDAVKSYDRALQLRPAAAEALVNRGSALIELKRYDDALATYAHALGANPNLAPARNGQANALFHMKRYEDAARAYASALRLDPDVPYGIGNLAYANLHACDWRSYGEDNAKLGAVLAAGKRAVNPFQALALLSSEEDQRRAASLWMTDKLPRSAHGPWRGPKYKHERIRIAYVSGDFNEHAVATLMAGVFERHDRDRFETIAIAFGDGLDSPMRARLQRAFTRFIDVEGKSVAEAAELIRGCEADIAVDLMGFTGDCRPGILESRPAPVQVQYLGFPGTMAAAHIDYLIADKTVVPATSASHYTEALAYLPDCYLPNDSTRAVSAAPPTRVEAGLPEAGFVFASFNNSYKFCPATFSVWMRVLQAVEGSVLWLAEPNAAASRNLKREAEARGVPHERIVFAPFAPRSEDHLARLRLADLFLDTLPYNAHATACDALWSGLPVLTASGSTFAGRVGASLLAALGMSELIAPSLEAYEKQAIAVGNNPPRLAELKRKLAANRSRQSLFDTALFTRRLESLFTEMWLREQNGAAPSAIG
jgi:protein O-GlcNAc transferase